MSRKGQEDDGLHSVIEERHQNKEEFNTHRKAASKAIKVRQTVEPNGKQHNDTDKPRFPTAKYLRYSLLTNC